MVVTDTVKRWSVSGNGDMTENQPSTHDFLEFLKAEQKFWSPQPGTFMEGPVPGTFEEWTGIKERLKATLSPSEKLSWGASFRTQDKRLMIGREFFRMRDATSKGMSLSTCTQISSTTRFTSFRCSVIPNATLREQRSEIHHHAHNQDYTTITINIMKNSETYDVYTGILSQYVANMRKFVTENSKRALNKKGLEAIYPYLQKDEIKYIPGPKYWILSVYIMSFEDFCWMRFKCLSEMELVDLILSGSLNTIRQVWRRENRSTSPLSSRYPIPGP